MFIKSSYNSKIYRKVDNDTTISSGEADGTDSVEGDRVARKLGDDLPEPVRLDELGPGVLTEALNDIGNKVFDYATDRISKAFKPDDIQLPDISNQKFVESITKIQDKLGRFQLFSTACLHACM